MAFCTTCGTQALLDAAFCGSCGASLAAPASPPPGPGVAVAMAPAATPTPASTAPTPTSASGTSFDQKLHITLIASAGLGVLLIFTTYLIALIGACSGAAFVLSIRLYLRSKQNNFAETGKLDWILVMIAAGLALIFMFAEAYAIQGFLLIFVAVRALMMYFAANSRN